MREYVLQVDVVDAGIHHLQQVLHVAGLQLLRRLLQLVAADGAHLVPHRLGLLQLVAYLEQLVAAVDLLQLLCEHLGIVGGEVEEHLLRLLHLLLHLIYRDEHRAHLLLAVLVAGELAELLGVGIVYLVEVLLDVGKVYHVAVLHVAVGTVHAGQGLQQGVVFQLAPQVEALQAVGIESREQHAVDDEQVGRVLLLVAVVDASPVLLVVEVVQDEFCRDLLMLPGSLLQIVLGDGGTGLRHKAAVAAAPPLQQAEHHACLRVGLADHHSRQRGVALLDAPPAEVIDDVVEQCPHVAGILQYLVAPHVLLLHPDALHQLLPHLLQSQAVAGFYVLAEYLLGEAVLDGAVVVVGADIVAKHVAGLQLLAYQGRSRQGEVYGAWVALEEACQEGATGIVVAVGLVEEVDALDVDGVGGQAHLAVAVLQLLDVHHDDLLPPLVALLGRGVLKGTHQLVAGLHVDDFQSPVGEFLGGLFHQVEAVNEEVVFRHDALVLVVVGQHAGGEIGQGRLARPLGVPDDAVAHPLGEFPANGLRAEQLGIAHHVLLQHTLLGVLIGIVEVDQSELQQIQQPFAAAERGEDAVGGGVGSLVGLVLAGGLDLRIVGVSEDEVLGGFVQGGVGIVAQKAVILLAEHVEHHLPLGTASVEGALKGFGCREVVVLVVAEDHQLRQVQESAELGVGQPRVVHAVVFCQHAAPVVGLFHLDEHQRQAVYHQGDVGTEALAAILAGHLRGALPGVVLRRVIVYHLVELVLEHLFIELAPQVFIAEHDAYLAYELLYLAVGDVPVVAAQLCGKGVCGDVGVLVEMQSVQWAIGIAYARQVHQRGNLYSCVFIKSCHIPSLLYHGIGTKSAHHPGRCQGQRAQPTPLYSQ